MCYCEHCRKRWFDETGLELPRKIDWNDPVFRQYALALDRWMADFANASTQAVKELKPHVTIEHQFSCIAQSWFKGSSEWIADLVDYCGGDYYGGYLQQTFINKYYKSVSPSLPFVYHTGRCDPELSFHTTTKTEEQILLHVVTALIHNGAFLLVDAINPDGSIVPEVYHHMMKSVYEKTMPYEKYISGDLNTDVGIWFASHAKFDPNETGIDMNKKDYNPRHYLEDPVAMASILRENNTPFDVIGSKNIRDYKGKVLALCHVAGILDKEMDDIEAFVEKGGSLYVSGPVANKRLEKLLGIHVTGQTEHNFTYMDPADDEGTMAGFTRLAPMTVTDHQYVCEILSDDVQVLATRTLPYAMTDTEVFSAIHSNPPGIHTGEPCMTMRRQGDSRLMWVAAPIESARPYMSRQVVNNLIKLLVGEPSWASNAPKFVEVISWDKDGETCFAVVNEQEESPVVPMTDIWVEVPGEHTAVALPDETPLPVVHENGRTKVLLERVELFTMFKIQ